MTETVTSVDFDYSCRLEIGVSVGKEGRIVLPKVVRQKHRVEEGTRLILRECGDQIILIPIHKYAKPTKAIASYFLKLFFE